MTTSASLVATPPAAGRRVLVLGANGRLGAAAGAAFADAGWDVLAQARRAPDALPAGARHLAIGLDDTAALARAASGARAVVYAVNPPYTAWRSELLPLARLGMDLAQRLDARFMLPGNVYNHGSSMPALLSEATPQRPDTVKGRLRAQLEAELAARADRGLRSVVVRAGDFFGGGRGNWFDLVVVKSLTRGRLAYPGPLDVPHAWAYLPDLARAFVAVAARDDLPAAATLHFAGHAPTGAALFDGVERAAVALGAANGATKLRRGGVPWALMRAGAPVVPMWRELVEMAYLWRVPHSLDGTLMQRLLGPLPSTPLDDALRCSLQALGFGATDAPSLAVAAPGPPPIIAAP